MWRVKEGRGVVREMEERKIVKEMGGRGIGEGEVEEGRGGEGRERRSGR